MAPPAESPLAAAAAELYNSSRNGSADAASMVQYLVASAVSEVFMTPSEPLVAYMDQHLKVVCHVPGPYCGGTAQEVATPIAAARVRHGDSNSVRSACSHLRCVNRRTCDTATRASPWYASLEPQARSVPTSSSRGRRSQHRVASQSHCDRASSPTG